MVGKHTIGNHPSSRLSVFHRSLGKILDVLTDYPYVIPPVFLIIVTYPYWGQTPALDPMIMYRQSTILFHGGILSTIRDAPFIHPPLLFLINAVAFFFFGNSPTTYNGVGLVMLLVASYTLYRTLRDIWNKHLATLTTLLLFCNPQVIINSFYLNYDMVILVFLVFALRAYILGKRWVFALVCAAMVTLKETALAIPLTFFLSESAMILFRQKTFREKMHALIRTSLVYLPTLFLFFAWQMTLLAVGASEWRAHIFTETTMSSYALALTNVITLKIFNQYFLQNIFNTFGLNFQWILTVDTLLLWIVYKYRRFAQTDKQKQFIHTLLSISVTYGLPALTFPTWTIPRYGVPLLLCLVFFFSLFVLATPRIFTILLTTEIVALTIVANVTSIDPLSRALGTTYIRGEEFYANDIDPNGPDGLFYNTQILKPIKKQNSLVRFASEKHADILIANCDEIKLAERIESSLVFPRAYPQYALTRPLACVSALADQEWDLLRGYTVVLDRPNDKPIVLSL